MKKIIPLMLLCGCISVSTEKSAYYNEEVCAKVNELKARGIEVTDWHIHARGGMDAKLALERERRSGVRSCILENHGRVWPLSDEQKVNEFIDKCHALAPMMPVGLQVNDRDWYKTLSAKTQRRLDFILADTMVMDGHKLWQEAPGTEDAAKWMERYMAHYMEILDEPVTILANPTYLPPALAARYDELWTEERMRKVIGKAVAKGIALEIQAGSDFPKMRFLKLAKEMGAKFSLGTNNFASNDKLEGVGRWFAMIEELGLTARDLLAAPKPNKYYRKRAVYLGDSITDARHIGTRRNWWQDLHDDLGLSYKVYAQNGAQMYALQDQAKKAHEELGDGVDVIFIFAGTNDYNANTPLGDWWIYSEQATNVNGTKTMRRQRTPNRDGNTFCGRVNNVMEYIKRTWPKSEVYLLTPLHRGFATFGKTNVQPDDSYANSKGYFIDDYVHALQRAGEIWSVPVIDLYTETGLLPAMPEYAHFFSNAAHDMLHPNACGHRRIANIVEKHLK